MSRQAKKATLAAGHKARITVRMTASSLKIHGSNFGIKLFFDASVSFLGVLKSTLMFFYCF